MADNLDFKEMLSYMRPEGSTHQRKFCNRYLRPVFGEPDSKGNFTLIIGDKPRIAFMAHHDTVHRVSGRSKVVLKGGFYRVEPEYSYEKTVRGTMQQINKTNCLGADCTTGVYIILKMIEAKIPGVYVIHAAEEIGCVGSAHIVDVVKPDWINHVDIAISFDRKGYDSIITHQMGSRTCSDAFAKSFAEQLDLLYEPDPTGSYTDSNEYKYVIAECTNISVGYFNQHTKDESQDKVFLDMLVEKLLQVDWGKLVVERDPTIFEKRDYKSDDWDFYRTHGWEGWMQKKADSNIKSTYKGPKGWPTLDDLDEPIKDETPVKSVSDTITHMAELVKENPVAIAMILHDMGWDAYDLIDDIADYEHDIKPSRGFSGF